METKMMASYHITGSDGRIITAAFVNSDTELMGVLKCYLALAANDPNIGEFTCRPAALASCRKAEDGFELEPLGPVAANSPARANKNSNNDANWDAACNLLEKRKYEDFDPECCEREFER